ncbi:hypothetical protein [Streptomyces sp. NPDC021020]|uniref:hypothetical protein n=1 Tax=Streptomyces sp. NPDC021020 TaxID=3365109 RepID=UPI0037878FCB
MSATAAHTRRLIEHRYGHPLDHLRREIAHRRSSDPVLAVVLRRLDALVQTGRRSRAARGALRTVLDDGTGDVRLGPYLAEVVDLEQREQSQAEALWDLLDVRLLLDRPGIRPAPAPSSPAAAGDLMNIAREAAAHLPRLTRDGLRLALRDRGIRINNHRLGLVLQQLRAERTC